MKDDAKVTLTIAQLRELVQEARYFQPLEYTPNDFSFLIDDEQADESLRGALSLSLLAMLLSVGNIVSAKEIRGELQGKQGQEQVQNALDSIGRQSYGGYSAVQATNILMRTLYAEARSESSLGRKMVATVIWNRAGGNADNLPKVCLAKKQFSCWNGLSSGAKAPSGFQTKVPSKVTNPGRSQDVWNEIKEIVEEMLGGTFEPEGDYNMYMNKATADKSAVNGWGSKMTDQVTVGSHTFGYLSEHDGFKKGNAVTPTYPATYKVKTGDNGVSYIARDLIKAKQTKYTDVAKLTKKIIELNSFKTDKKGNPIIQVGQTIKLPT